MATDGTAASQRIVLTGLAEMGPVSEMTVILVDGDGRTLYRTSVNEDGSCELPSDTLASSQEVRLEPISVVVRTNEFRERLDDETLDVAALLAGSAKQAPASAPAVGLSSLRPGPDIDHCRPPDHPGHPR
ncbi:MAG TPA: hypothetical protein VF526_14355 [Solirubrobacteraceae bacterium]|jgi:hypothetical protein